MPGNEVGDRVRNFFAQDNLSQGQHHSQIVDGSWQQPDNNLWAASQRHIGFPNSSSKNYNIQQSDIERQSSHSFSLPQGLNPTQSTLRPDIGTSHSETQQPNLNGYMQGRQFLQTRQNEANFLGMDTESDSHSMTSRGLSSYEKQQGNGLQNHTNSLRSESSESPVSFDFFGSQQQVNVQHAGMQSLPRQQSGFSDMRVLQQQVMLRKMQELQRQQQIQQLEARQPNSINQFPSSSEQASGSHSPVLVNGTTISPVTDSSNYAWATEPTAVNTNWPQHATPIFQGSSNALSFPPGQSQALSSMGLFPQQSNQSFYGVPVSNTGSAVQPYSNIPLNKPPVQQMAMYSHSFPGNQHTAFSDEVSIRDGSFVSRQGFHGEHIFGHASGQGLNSGTNLENLQQVHALQRSAPVQKFHERQELAGPSETLPEKTVMQAASSQNEVALDPTEEKILFGDDNIWDAFGSSTNMGAGGFNVLNGTGFSNGLPSIQSGSWSALMQSAVAETSSSDVGLNEQWSSLGYQNDEVSAGNRQPLTYEDSTKKQTVLADNNLQIASTLNSGSVSMSDDAIINNSYQCTPGFQQSRQYEHGGRLLTGSAHRSVPQSLEAGSKWLSRGPLQKPLDQGKIHGNAAHALDAEINPKSISESWAPQQSVSLYESGQTLNKPNGRGSGDFVSSSGNAMSKFHGSDDKLQHFHSNDKKAAMYESPSSGNHIWKADSGSNSTVGLEAVKSSMGNSQANREDYSLNNFDVVPNSSTTKASQSTNQLLPNSHHHNYTKHADSPMQSRGSENSGNQHHPNKGPQVLESSMISSDRVVFKTHDMENSDRKENSSDSRNNVSQHATTGGLRENDWSDGTDSRNVPSGKQKLSGQAGRRTPGPRKFQYHPMGNLDEDVEPSHGMRQANHSQVVSQQIPRTSSSHNQGSFEQSKIFGQFPRTSGEMGKGHLPDLQGNRQREDSASSRGTLPGFVPKTSASFDSSVGIYAPNKAAQSSQNMLELLHKVDQPKEGYYDGSSGHLQQNQTSASQGFNLQLAPPSQGLPVQNHALASQKSTQADNYCTSNHPSQDIRDKGHTWLSSPAQVHSLPSSREMSQGEAQINKVGIPGQTGNEALGFGMWGNSSSKLPSGFSHSGSRLQNQQVLSVSGKVTTNQPMNIFSDRHASHFPHSDDSTSRVPNIQSQPTFLPDTAGPISCDKPVSSGDTFQPTEKNHSHERASDHQISVGRAVLSSQAFITSGISQPGAFPKITSNAWSNVPGQQHFLGPQRLKFPSNIFQPSQPDNNVIQTSVRQDQDVRKGGNCSSEFIVNSTDSQILVSGEGKLAKESVHQLVSPVNTDEKMSASQGKESVRKNPPEASPSNSSSTQRDIEAFGRSLKPNNFLNQKYALLHQMQAMRSSEIDPSNRDLKRLKVSDSALAGQISPKAGQFGECNVMGRDALVHHGAGLIKDSKMVSFSGPADNRERNASSQLGNIPPHPDMLGFNQKGPENLSRSGTASVGVENSQISSQMAPPWFSQFGTFRKGHILPMYDTQNNASAKTVEQPFTLGKSSDPLRAHNSLEEVNAAADSNQVGNSCERENTTFVATEPFTSPQSLARDVTDQSLAVSRPKKRKTATSDLLPWHEEMTRVSRSLSSLSMAEVNWAKAAHRLIDKVEDQADLFFIEDGPPVLRPKRRLILTTQLMQQLFCPPPAAVLSADASSNYETVVYRVARLALGDACSLSPCSGGNVDVSLDSSNLLCGTDKTSERVGNDHLSKVMEDFIGRARKLENDFVRLDKRASVLDLRIECQDLEKFSVINRFAKFFVRGQSESSDGAETSSSSDAAQRPCPQRYVTALPVPKNLPDRVQCLSL